MTPQDIDIAGLDIDQLAALLREGGKPDAGSDFADFAGQPPCLSLAQERLWFMDRLAPRNPFYNIPFAFRLEGRVDATALKAAWLDVLERHEALRVRIGSDEDGGAVVSVRPVQAYALACRNHVSEDGLALAMRHEAETGFDLGRDPLVRGALLGLDDGGTALVFTAHHIVFDGWSIGIFLQDLSRAYAARMEGRRPAWEPLAATYFQYAAWHRALVERAKPEEAAWWQERLANLPDFEPATDMARPAVQTFRGAVHGFDVDAAVMRGIEALARAEQATPYAVWLALFALAAARFAAQSDFAIGSSFAGRAHPAAEHLAGFFVENLSIRLSVDPQASLRDLIRQARDASLAVMEHALLPFQMLAEALGRERDLSRNPVYQTAFTYQNMPGDDPAAASGPLRLQALPMPALTTHMDLELLAWPGRNGMRCQVLYATDLFHEDTIRRFATRFTAIAERAATAPEAALLPAGLLGLDARARSVLKGALRAHALVRPWQDFAALCAASPDTMAVRALARDGQGAERSLTRGELLHMAEVLAGALAARGAGKGTVVLLSIDQGPELMAAMLAVWRQGAVWTTIASSHPASYARWAAADAGAVCALGRADTWQGDPALLVDIDAALTAPAAAALPVPVEPRDGDTACLLYTSGTTGRPKGVLLSFAALSNRLRWMWEQYPLTPGEPCCQKTSPVFVDYLWETFGPLLGEALLVTVPDGAAADIPWFVHSLERCRVTRLVLVPSLLAEMHRIDGGLGGRLTSLRVLTASGETLPCDLAAATIAALPSARLLNLYGSTEVMGDATFYEVLRAETGSVPIGAPVHNTVCAVLDRNGRILPRGAVGVLYVAGRCLAQGYGGAAAASSGRAFMDREHHEGIDNAAWEALCVAGGEDRWFCTGDLARIDERGQVLHCGRADRQVKIRGVRIEPEQIRAVLERHNGVKDGRVLAMTGPVTGDGPVRPDPRLVAYVIPRVIERKDNARTNASRASCLARWSSLYDSMYASVRREGNILDNFLIWESSYTGRHLPAEDMHEWLADSLASIRALKPETVLEIGCGQGFLLMDLVRRCRRYAGLDFSAGALACLDDVLKAEQTGPDGGFRAELILKQGEASSLPPLEELGGEPYDTAVFNSVVQYFPDHAYCIEAIRQACDRLGDGGRVFLGDLRNYAGLDLLHAAIQLHRRKDGATAREFLDMANARKRLESELLLDPSFWQAVRRLLPRTAFVVSSPKPGRCDNELTEFRYETVLYLDRHPFTPFDGDMHLWGGADCASQADLEALLDAATRRRPFRPLAVAGVPHARLAVYRRVRETCEESVLAGTNLSLEEALESARARSAARPDERGLNPCDLHDMARRHGLQVQISFDPRDGLSFNVLFHGDGPAPCLDAPWPAPARPCTDPAALASAPAASRDESGLRAELRVWLESQLPKSMLPDVILTVPEWPRTPSGKIDWKRLPSPNTRLFTGTGGMQLPGTQEETRLADIWKLVIGIDEVSVHDNFFEIGGTSLLLTQVHQLIRTRMGRSFPLSVLFQYPTIRALAAHLAESGREGDAAGRAPQRAPGARAAAARRARRERPARSTAQ